MTNKKDSFIMFSEHREFFRKLSPEQAGILINALFDYSIDGVEVKLEPILDMAFTAIRQDLDRNAVKYEERRERMRLNGLKGGRPKKADVEEIPSEVRTEDELTNEIDEIDEIDESVYKEDDERDETDSIQLDEENCRILSFDCDSEEINEEQQQQENTIKEDIGESGLCLKDEDILYSYIRTNFNVRNVKAYASTLIKKGDHVSILENIKGSSFHKKLIELKRHNRIMEEIKNVRDKESCTYALAEYYKRKESPPQEYGEIAKKYDLDSIDKVRANYNLLLEEKQKKL